MMTDEQVQWMKDAKTETEWNAACDRVKKAHRGYPSDWFAKIVISGIAASAQAKFAR